MQVDLNCMVAPTNATNTAQFECYPSLLQEELCCTTEYTLEAFAKLGNPVAHIKAIHSSRTTTSANSDLADGLEPCHIISKGCMPK